MSSAQFQNQIDNSGKYNVKAVTQLKKDVKLIHGYLKYSAPHITTCGRDQRSE